MNETKDAITFDDDGDFDAPRENVISNYENVTDKS